jgi:Type I restriction modification DNA specificity domain.
MNLDDREYGFFKVSDLFDVKYGVNLELNACDECDRDAKDSVNFVARTAENNGVSSRVIVIDGVTPQKAGLISVAGGGSVLSTFLQSEPFYSGRDLYTLEAKDDISDEAKMFVITVIEQNKYRYSYGRQANKTLPDLELRLPIKQDGKPDWQFMEDYIKSLHHKPLTTKNKTGQAPELNLTGWKEFRVSDFFDIHPTKAIDGISADDCGGVGVPLIVNSAENNGVAGLCDLLPTEDGGIITFSDTTDGNTFFYQPDPFIGFAHVQGMYPKTRSWTESELLFVCTMLTFDARGRYNYGRKMRRDTIAEVMLKLPADADGNPDWQFMENYIKVLPYGDRLADKVVV